MAAQAAREAGDRVMNLRASTLQSRWELSSSSDRREVLGLLTGARWDLDARLDDAVALLDMHIGREFQKVAGAER